MRTFNGANLLHSSSSSAEYFTQISDTWSAEYSRILAALNIQRARILEYSADHVSEIWVKYSADEEEEWSKFAPLKVRTSTSLPAPECLKYTREIPLKANKLSDVIKIVDRYVPEPYKDFIIQFQLLYTNPRKKPTKATISLCIVVLCVYRVVYWSVDNMLCI